jgi:hypothetical protein
MKDFYFLKKDDLESAKKYHFILGRELKENFYKNYIIYYKHIENIISEKN